MNRFFKYAEKEGVDFDEDGYNNSETFIKHQLKALIARNFWDMNAYFEVIKEVDDGYLKAVEIINNDELFEELQLTDY